MSQFFYVTISPCAVRSCLGLTVVDEVFEQEAHDAIATFAAVLGHRVVDGWGDEDFQHAHGDRDGAGAAEDAAQVSERDHTDGDDVV